METLSILRGSLSSFRKLLIMECLFIRFISSDLPVRELPNKKQNLYAFGLTLIEFINQVLTRAFVSSFIFLEC